MNKLPDLPLPNGRLPLSENNALALSIPYIPLELASFCAASCPSLSSRTTEFRIFTAEFDRIAGADPT